MRNDRRDFFKKAAGAAATLATVEAVRDATGTTPTADAAVVVEARAFVAGRFALEYLTPNLGEALFTLNFQHLGIFKLAPEKVEAGNEQIKRVKAEMYCEEVTFQFGKSAASC